MYTNNMINPIMPVAFNPYYMPMQVPVQIPMAMQPVNLKIDVTPAQGQAAGHAQNSGTNVIYNIPKVSLYDNKKSATEHAELTKSVDKQIENKNIDNKLVEAKSKENLKDTSFAGVLAAQAGVNVPQPIQFKSAEANQKADSKSDDKKDVKRNKPQVVAPDAIKPSIDIDGLVSILTSPDYEEQADAMEAISEVTMYAPERAGELLDKKVVDNLVNIIDKDTSALKGEDKQKAERNKEYAMYTTAVLQKLYADNVKALGNVNVPAEDLIGISSIVKNLKTNPNESIREAAVASLGYVNKPEYNGKIDSLIAQAAGDKSATVRAQANKQLAKA